MNNKETSCGSLNRGRLLLFFEVWFKEVASENSLIKGENV